MEDKNKLGQEPAFPYEHINNDGYRQSFEGMSKRLYIATKLVQGMLSNMAFLEFSAQTAKKNNRDYDEFLVFTAYTLTDELLKQEKL